MQKGRWHSTIQFAWVFHCRHLLTLSGGACVASLVAWVQRPSYFWLGSFPSDLISVQCMVQLSVDLERFTQRLHFSGILCVTFGSTSRCLFSLLHISLLFISCLLIQVDRTDVALGATSIRLQCHSQPWTVPTPLLQSFH